MINRYLILFSLMLCLGLGISGAQAQNYRYKIKVILVNGNVVNGYLAEPWGGGNIHLQLSNNSYMKIDSLDIKKVQQADFQHTGVYRSKAGRVNMQIARPTTEGTTTHQSNTSANSTAQIPVIPKERYSDFQHKKGFYHHLMMGMAFGELYFNPSLGLVNGYWFGDRFAAGIGINYDNYDRAEVMPVYVQPRYYLKHDKASFYLFSDLGYGMAWAVKNRNDFNFHTISAKGGFMGQLGLGYQLNFAHSALSFTLGIKNQQTTTRTESYTYMNEFDNWGNVISTVQTRWMDAEERRLNRRIVLTMGFTL